MKAQCRESERLISFYQDGELGASEMKRLSDHIQSCPQCRRRYESLGWTSEIARAALSSPPSIDYDDIWRDIRQDIPDTRVNTAASARRPLKSFLTRIRQSFFRPMVLAPAFAACVAAALILICAPPFFHHHETLRASSVESVSTRTGSVMIMQTATTGQPIIWILDPPAKEKSL